MDNPNKFYINMVDDDFFKPWVFNCWQEDYFPKTFPADTLSRFVVNEEAVKTIWFRFSRRRNRQMDGFRPEGEQHITLTIIGVVKEFSF